VRPQAGIVIKDGTDVRAVDEGVGKWVRLEGIVTNSKQPQIAGVDVEERTDPIPEFIQRMAIRRGEMPAWAEGVLERTVVRPEDLIPLSANRGAGTFYRLIDPATGRTAEAHPVNAPE
jgi:hypothetical protein